MQRVVWIPMFFVVGKIYGISFPEKKWIPCSSPQTDNGLNNYQFEGRDIHPLILKAFS